MSEVFDFKALCFLLVLLYESLMPRESTRTKAPDPEESAGTPLGIDESINSYDKI